MVDQSTPGSNPYVLQMSFNPADLAGAYAGQLELGWFNGSNQWVNAIEGNSSQAGDAFVFGGYDSSLMLGHFGVDTVNDVVWAVVDNATPSSR